MTNPAECFTVNDAVPAAAASGLRASWLLPQAQLVSLLLLPLLLLAGLLWLRTSSGVLSCLSRGLTSTPVSINHCATLYAPSAHAMCLQLCSSHNNSILVISSLCA
jgi:hypothetical protein